MQTLNDRLSLTGAIWALLVCLIASTAAADSYHLDIERRAVNITGKPVEKITINGTIPGPTLRFHEGEDVTISVTNHMDELTAIHWHGVLVPANMDGVVGLNDFHGIKPHETFTYRFKVRQSGTYWYHSHFSGQEQSGLYGPIVIDPKGNDPIAADRDYVVLLSDFTDEEPEQILHHLKMDSAYYNYSQPTVFDMLNRTWQETKMWAQMRMSPTDLTDVSGYTFLMNGKTPAQNWTGLFTPNQRVRLRFINASSMSIYDLRIPGLTMKVVQADGQRVEPVSVDELRFGVGETYDVIVQPKDSKVYTIVAEPIDRTGFALATLAPKEGMKGETPAHRPRTTLTMSDMGDMSAMDMTGMDMSTMDMTSGWAKAGTPEGSKALIYSDLHFFGTQPDTRAPTRDITVTLDGNMQRYIWTLNGRTMMDAEPIMVKYGERVRLKYVNNSMMAHLMHLHGMFVQLENGQPLAKLPSKHSVIVAPGQTVSVLLTANESGQWSFHCHMLYHMMSGMMTELVVSKKGNNDTAASHMEQHHVH